MKERVYLKDRMIHPRSFPLEHNAERAKNSRADEQHREEKRHQPSRPLLEELSSQVAPIQIGAKLGAAKSGTKNSLVVEEDAMDHFFNISCGKADTTIFRIMEVAGATNDPVSGIRARELLENQLKQNELARQVAIDVRPFYPEMDFSSVDIEFGDYHNRF